MTTEDKKEVAEKEDSTLKKMKILAKKELKRAKEKGEKLVKQHGAKAAMALTIGGASLSATEASAQTYDQFKNAPEMHISSNGSVTIRQNGSAQTGGGTANFQAARRAQAQQQLVSRVTVHGERVMVPAQMRHKTGILVYSEAYSFGLNHEHIAAYINPNEVSPDPSNRFVYYADETLDGRFEITMRHNQEYVNNGGGPYAIPFRDRKAILRGAMRGGVGVVYGGGYSEMDAALDGAHQALDYVAAGVELVDHAADVLGYGSHVVGKTTRILKGGAHRSPRGGRIPGSRGGRP